MIDLIILGNVPSKSNSYRIITLPVKGAIPCRACGQRETHASSLAKTSVMSKYEKSYQQQIGDSLRQDISGRLTATIRVYYDSERPDTDGCLKAALDGLQPPKVKDGADRIPGVILNDRQIRKIILERFLDRDRPRIEIALTEYIGPDEQLLFAASTDELIAWLESNAPEHIKRPLLDALTVEF